MKTDTVTFIILGATGDLTKRKLIPAIYNLVKDKKIKKFAIVGAARNKTKMTKILSLAKPYIKNINNKVWNRLTKSAHYYHLDFYQEEDYNVLGNVLSDIEKKCELSGNRVFYLAAAPQHFDKITLNLQKSKIAKQNTKRWVRVVYEKPFGWDLKSAKKINKCISRVFKEKQVYRIDHYLGKELVGDIALMRFTNRILEPLWSKRDIHSIQIIMDEDVGLEGRGDFYEHYGAFKDVVQNHAMQLLTLTTMEAPKSLRGEYLRKAKADILKQVTIKDALFGQYPGYKKIKGVAKNSKVNTFVALHLQINNNRWRGVPIFIRAGKFLDKKETSIHIKFKKVHCLLSRTCPSDTNYFTIRIQPDDGFEFELNSKVPGVKNVVSPVKMDFCQGCRNQPNTPEAYENLLEDVLKGDQSVFIRNDEIENAWKIIDQVNVKRYKVYPYKKGSKGPKQLEQWSKKHNLQWHS